VCAHHLRTPLLMLPPAVLRAIGVEEDLAHTSIRFGIGRFTTEVWSRRRRRRRRGKGGLTRARLHDPPCPLCPPAQAEVDYTIDLCARHVARLREMSPLWEMVQEGVDIKSIQWSQEH
jgi:cysteine desulfurase